VENDANAGADDDTPAASDKQGDAGDVETP
jgi:hypothetical protein